MEKKFLKQTAAAVLLTSSILSFSPAAYGKTTSIEQSIEAVKLELKKATTHYVHPALDGELVSSSALYPILNNAKKNYEATKKALLASNLSEKEKQAKLGEIEALYQEKITKGLVPYIDAFNYASKYLDPLLAEVKKAEEKNDFAAVEKAYHALSFQLKGRTSILYRFSGKASRDLLLEKYKKPSDEKREELVVPVTIYMKVMEAEKLIIEGKLEEAKKVMESVQELVEKLPKSSQNSFLSALVDEVDNTRKDVGLPPLTPTVPEVPVASPSIGGGGGGGGGGSITPSETPSERALRLAKEAALAELNAFKETDYSAENWRLVIAHKNSGITAINSAKTIVEVGNALTAAKTEIGKVKNKLQEADEATAKELADFKEAAIAELSAYKKDLVYGSENIATIDKLKNDATEEIDEAKSKETVSSILTEVKSEIDKLKTAEEEAVEVLVKAKLEAEITLKEYKDRVDYTDDKWAVITELLNEGVDAIKAAMNISEIESLVVDYKGKIDLVKTIAQEEQEKITANVTDQMELKAALLHDEKSIINIQNDIEITESIKVERKVEINGGGYTIKVRNDLGGDNTSKHALLVMENGISIEDLILDNASNAYGIQFYKAKNANLENVTILGSKGAALTVNGAEVVATNLNTNGNAWGAVNVDPGSNVKIPSVFTLKGDGVLTESLQIWSDGRYVSESATVVVDAKGYEEIISSENALKVWTNKALSNSVTIQKDGKTIMYPTLKAAVEAADNGATINVGAGTYELSKQLKIEKPVTIVGHGEVVIKAASNFVVSTHNPDNNLISIIGVKDSVKLENLNVSDSKRSGINVFESSDVQLNNINSTNNTAAGLIVANSLVTATNFNTSGNVWYGINVDNGSSPSNDAPATNFTLNSGIISETTQIITDKGGVTVNVPKEYKMYKVDGTTKSIWSNNALAKGATIVGKDTLYPSIQAAIDAADNGATINVGTGTYELSKQLKIEKPVTIVGHGEVVIKAASNFGVSSHNPDNNLISIIGVKDSVKLGNLTVSESKRSGINVFESSDVKLDNTNSTNNTAAGLIVTNSKVEVSNFNTSGNKWYGINVDNGSSPSSDAPATSFTLKSGTITEATQIITDKGGVTVNATDYREYKIAGTSKTIWTNKEPNNAVFIEGKDALYQSIQAAIDAAVDGDTINIGAGTYTGIFNINKRLTLKGSANNMSIINGEFHLTAGSNDTTIDGFTINIGETGYGVNCDAGIGDVTITNNVITANSNGNTALAVYVNAGWGTSNFISGNKFKGVYNEAAVTVDVYPDSMVVTKVIGNDFTEVTAPNNLKVYGFEEGRIITDLPLENSEVKVLGENN